MRGRFRRADVHVQRANSVHVDRFRDDAHAAQSGFDLRERGERLVERLARGAEIEKRAEKHVAGDSADGIERKQRHCAAARAMRAAWNPAEKPLSTLTTETLGAHELIIASSVATPWRFIP